MVIHEDVTGKSSPLEERGNTAVIDPLVTSAAAMRLERQTGSC